MFKSTAIYSLSYGINRGLFLLYFPFLTSYLSLSDFGLYALFLILSQLLLPLQSLNGSTVIMREGVANQNLAVNIYIKYIVITLFITSLSSYLIYSISFEDDYWWIVYSFLLSGGEAILLLTLTFFRSQDKTLIYLYITILKAILVLSIILFTMKYDMELKSILQWQSSITIFFSLLLAIIIAIKNTNIINISKIKLKKNLLFGIVLIPHGISQWILNSSNRFTIKYIEDDISLGIYTIGYTLASILFFINSGIAMAIPQLMIKNYKSWIMYKKDTIFIKYYSISAVIIYIFLWLFVYVDKYFFNLLHYYNMDMLLTFIFSYLGIFILGYYYFFANYLFYHRLAKTISIQTVSIALINVILTIILVYLIGLVGASLATLISYGFYFIIVLNMAKQIEKRLNEQLTIIIKILSISFLILSAISIFGVMIIQ